MEIKPEKIKAVFKPSTMGIFVLLLIILSFSAGMIKNEMALVLVGAVFLTVWTYCLLMILVLAVFHKFNTGKIVIHLTPDKITAGGVINVICNYTADIFFKFQLPGILVRCAVFLKTIDNRRVSFLFKPLYKNEVKQNDSFIIEKRGAYFSAYDKYVIYDALGFFSFSYLLPALGRKILAGPKPSADTVSFSAKGGDFSRQDAPPVERTDELSANRPYIPGDDPRRINWKLYGHGISGNLNIPDERKTSGLSGGDLFVRIGEREPPPSSTLTILIDTQYDSLYSTGFSKNNSVNEAVDILCEYCLSILNSTRKDVTVSIGFTGSQSDEQLLFTDRNDLGFSLAYPAAMPLYHKQKKILSTILVMNNNLLPDIHDDSYVLLLALPRNITSLNNQFKNKTNIDANVPALDKFLHKYKGRQMELVFVYSLDNSLNKERSAKKLIEVAESCVNYYKNFSNVKVHSYCALRSMVNKEKPANE